MRKVKRPFLFARQVHKISAFRVRLQRPGTTEKKETEI